MTITEKKMLHIIFRPYVKAECESMFEYERNETKPYLSGAPISDFDIEKYYLEIAKSLKTNYHSEGCPIIICNRLMLNRLIKAHSDASGIPDFILFEYDKNLKLINQIKYK